MAAISTESVFFANKGTLKITGSNATPAQFTVMIIKDIEITAGAEHVPLFGWGTIRRQAVARHTGKVGVRIGFAKFLPKAANWLFYINDPASGSGTLTDTNTVKTFTVVVTLDNEAAPNETLTITVYDVYFSNFPLKAAEGQWMRVDLDGEGAYMAMS